MILEVRGRDSTYQTRSHFDFDLLACNGRSTTIIPVKTSSNSGTRTYFLKKRTMKFGEDGGPAPAVFLSSGNQRNGNHRTMPLTITRYGLASLAMVATLVSPTSAFFHGNLPPLPSRASSIGFHGGKLRCPPQLKCEPNANLLKLIARQHNQKWREKSGSTTSTRMNMSLVTDDEFETDHVPLKEDENFKKAVEEVKDAALNVTESSVKLTSTIVTKGPGIIGRLLTALLSKEFRYV